MFSWMLYHIMYLCVWPGERITCACVFRPNAPSPDPAVASPAGCDGIHCLLYLTLLRPSSGHTCHFPPHPRALEPPPVPRSPRCPRSSPASSPTPPTTTTSPSSRAHAMVSYTVSRSAFPMRSLWPSCSGGESKYPLHITVIAKCHCRSYCCRCWCCLSQD